MTFFDDLEILAIDMNDILFYKVLKTSKSWRLAKKDTDEFIDLDHNQLLRLYSLLTLYFGYEHNDCGSL